MQGAAAQGDGAFSKETFQYAKRGERDLYLDRIVDNSVPVAGKRPVLIYSFGGGWEMGERYDRSNTKFLRFIASLGYTVVTIDYRLGIQEAKAKKEQRRARQCTVDGARDEFLVFGNADEIVKIVILSENHRFEPLQVAKEVIDQRVAGIWHFGERCLIDRQQTVQIAIPTTQFDPRLFTGSF